MAMVTAAAAICAATSFAAGPSAGAAATCRLGNVCVYDTSGNIIFQSPGNVSGRSFSAFFVWNNGRRDPGFDHVNLFVRDDSGAKWRICLHYGPQNTGADRTVVHPGPGDVVTGWTWRRECDLGEDNVWIPVP